jgi:hypothetical protein
MSYGKLAPGPGPRPLGFLQRGFLYRHMLELRNVTISARNSLYRVLHAHIWTIWKEKPNVLRLTPLDAKPRRVAGSKGGTVRFASTLERMRWFGRLRLVLRERRELDFRWVERFEI